MFSDPSTTVNTPGCGSSSSELSATTIIGSNKIVVQSESLLAFIVDVMYTTRGITLRSDIINL